MVERTRKPWWEGAFMVTVNTNQTFTDPTAATKLEQAMRMTVIRKGLIGRKPILINRDNKTKEVFNKGVVNLATSQPIKFILGAEVGPDKQRLHGHIFIKVKHSPGASKKDVASISLDKELLTERLRKKMRQQGPLTDIGKDGHPLYLVPSYINIRFVRLASNWETYVTKNAKSTLQVNKHALYAPNNVNNIEKVLELVRKSNPAEQV